MSVNLVELDESRFVIAPWFVDTGPWGDEVADAFNEWCALVDAVLDAPRVWWCEGHPEDMCEAESPHDPPLPCRWVVLVPVEGEGR